MDLSSLDPMQYGTQLELLKQSGGLLTSTVQPGQGSALPSAIDAYRKRAMALYQQGSDLYNKEPDMTELQAFAKQRGDQGNDAMLNALAAQFAGESFQPVQAQFLKKAAAAQEPMKVGSGMLTSDGKYLKDPFAGQEKKAEFLLQQAKAYETLAQTAQTAQERAEATRLQNEMMNQLRLMGLNFQQQGLDIQRQGLQIRRDLADKKSDGQVGSFSPAGFTPQGQQVVTNTKSGVSYILSVQPDGTPNYTPYQGTMIPKATFDKEVGAAGDLSAVAARADKLVQMVESNPAAFGLRSAGVSALPGAVQGYAAKAVGLTPQQLEARSTVLRQAAQEINDLYGAALSMGEQARAATFLPNPSDPPEMLISKLKAARDWAKTQMGRYSPGVTNAATQRSGSAPAPSGGMPSLDAIAAELARRGVK